MSDPGPSTSAAADRIAALVGQLTPLADATTGELIKAQDWNVLVGALIEVARAVLAEPPATATAPHTHTDQVAVGWLDDNLRNLVERGPLSDPAVESRVGGLERQVALLASRIEALGGRMDDTGQRLSSIATNDLVRANDVATVRRNIDGLGDSKLDVAQLRSSLRDLQAGVATAVTVGQQLTVDGQPVDFSAFNDRLKSVETLRGQLSLPTGELFNPQTLDQRLTNLQSSLVDKDELASVLAGHTATLSDDQLSTLQAGARDEAVAAVTPSIAASADALRAEVSAQLAGVDDKVSKAVGDGRADTVAAALAAMRPELAAAVTQARTDLTAAIGQQVGAATSGLRAELGGRIDAVTSGLPAQVASQVGQQLGTRLDSLNATVASLSTRLDRAEVRLTTHDGTFTQLSAQVAQTARDDAAARDALGASFKADLDQRDQVAAAKLDSRLAELDAADQQRLTAAVTSSQQTLTSQIQQIASAAAASQVETAVSGLRTEIGTLRDSGQVVRPVLLQPRLDQPE